MIKKVIGFMFVVLFFIFVIRSQHRTDEKEFTFLFEAAFEGKLDRDVWANSGGNHIMVNGVMYVAKIVTRISGDGEYITFSDFARKGDFILKKEFSDTLILEKTNGEMYLFFFEKHSLY